LTANRKLDLHVGKLLLKQRHHLRTNVVDLDSKRNRFN
jgi:hypothetical protein